MNRFLLLAAMLLALPALAAIESREFDDPAREARYYSLIDKLRCLVCQNQNLADSNAELARDLRDRTYEMIQAGRSDEEIMTFMVDRYGQFVLYEPPFNLHTLLLWLAPALLAAIGAVVFYRLAVRRRAATEAPPAAELARARALLDEKQD